MLRHLQVNVLDVHALVQAFRRDFTLWKRSGLTRHPHFLPPRPQTTGPQP